MELVLHGHSAYVPQEQKQRNAGGREGQPVEHGKCLLY